VLADKSTLDQEHVNRSELSVGLNQKAMLPYIKIRSKMMKLHLTCTILTFESTQKIWLEMRVHFYYMLAPAYLLIFPENMSNQQAGGNNKSKSEQLFNMLKLNSKSHM
jgi:hypothetical protein